MKALTLFIILFLPALCFGSPPDIIGGNYAPGSGKDVINGDEIDSWNDRAEASQNPLTISLLHRSGVSTAYELPAGFTQSEYVTFEIEPGAIMTWVSGVTPSFIPDQINALPNQQIWDGAGGLGFVEAGTIPLDWNGILPNIETEAQATINLDGVNQLIDAVTGVTGCVLSLGAGSEYWFEASDRGYFWLRDNTNFKGVSKYTSGFNWIDFDPLNDDFYGLMKNSKTSPLVYNDIINLSFQDMFLDNSGVSPNNPSGSGGWGSRGSTLVLGQGISQVADPEITTRNLTIENTVWKSWALPQSIYQAQNVKILDSDFLNGEGVSGTPSITVMNGSIDVIISGNYIEDILWESGTQSSINVQASNLIVDSNVAKSTFYGGGLLFEGGYNAVFSNNIIDLRNAEHVDCNGMGIQGTPETGCTDVTVQGNLFIMNPDIPVSDTSRGVSVSRNTHNISVKNNTFKNFGIGVDFSCPSGGYYMTGSMICESNLIENSRHKHMEFDTTNADVDAEDTTFTVDGNIMSGETSAFNIKQAADAGTFTATNNIGGTINLVALSEDHRTRLGMNSGPEDSETYYYYWYQVLPDADAAQIEWLDAIYLVSEELDLSGADTTHYMLGLDPNETWWVPKVDIYYTEATSADTGVDINFQRYDTSGILGWLPAYTSTVSTPIRTMETHRLKTNQSYYEYPMWFATRTVGGKTGTGAVRVIWTLIKQ